MPPPPDTLIDRIYQAAIVPEGWPALLAEVGTLVGARGGLLFAGDQTTRRSFGSPGADLVLEGFIEAGYAQQNLVRIGRLIERAHPGFLSEGEFSTPEEMATLPMYTEFLFPLGFIAAAGTAIDGLAGEQLIMSVEGFPSLDHAAAAVPLLDTLRPHLARAGLLAARLGLERARTAVATLEMIGVPGALVANGGALLAANALFQTRIPGFGTDTPRGLRLIDQAADRKLAAALGALSRRPDPRHGQGVSIPVRRKQAFPLVMHVLPVCGAARDIFAGTLAVLLLAERGRRRAPDAELIQALLDLTPAEARLAQALVVGETLNDAAAASHVTVATARTHLKRIFLKTGLNRQADLTTLLADISLP